MARRPRDAEADEPPPWLEPRARAAAPRAEEPRHTIVSWRTLIIGAVVALVLAIGLVIGARTLVSRDQASVANGEAGLIRAPAEPYKTRPDSPDVPALEGEGQTIYETADGADPMGRLDVNAVPEEPQRPPPRDLLPQDPAAAEDGDAALIGAPPEPSQPAPPPSRPAIAAERVAAPAPRPSAPRDVAAPPPSARAPRAIVEAALAPRPKPQPQPPAPAPSGGSGAVQLGAFSTEGRAEAARDRLAARFPELSAFRITSIERDGQTLYRLRGTAADTAAACAKLKLAGESCIAAQ